LCSFTKAFFVVSLLHRGFIFACLPDFYLFGQGGFKAMAFRRLVEIFKPLALPSLLQQFIIAPAGARFHQRQLYYVIQRAFQ